MDTAITALRSSPLGAELTPSESSVLGELIVLKSLKDGEVLLPEGARDALLHVVVRGQICVVKKGERGPQQLHRLEPGDLVGELSFMDDEPRYAALVASGPTEVLCLRRSDFETLVDHEPRVVYKTMRAIMRVAHRVQRRLALHSQDLENYVYRSGALY
jgi:CRP/FNR family transcriptional regulator